MKNMRAGDIIAVQDSDDEFSNDDKGIIREARMKRMKGRETLTSDHTNTAHRDPSVSLRGTRGTPGFTGNPKSLRLHQFADLSYDDDEDLDLPSPAGGTIQQSQYIDRDPYQPSALIQSRIPSDNPTELVDLDSDEIPRRCIAGHIPSLPIPTLSEAMALFKLKIASKKDEINAANALHELTSEKVCALQGELLAVKTQLDTARQRFEQLDDHVQSS